MSCLKQEVPSFRSVDGYKENYGEQYGTETLVLRRRNSKLPEMCSRLAQDTEQNNGNSMLYGLLKYARYCRLTRVAMHNTVTVWMLENNMGLR
jgi:hypothetical protein